MKDLYEKKPKLVFIRFSFKSNGVSFSLHLLGLIQS